MDAEFKAELKEIKGIIRELELTIAANTAALAEYNGQLKIHIQASKDLHERVLPLEDHVKFLRGLVKLGMKILAAGASAAAIVRYLFWK